MPKLKVCGAAVALLFVLSVSSSYVAAEKYVVCYYGSWATYRSGLGKFDVDHINPDLCTHAVYSFAGFDDQGTIVALDSWLDLPDNWGRNNFGAFNALKQKNPQLKTLLAVGGWNFGSAKFSVMTANPTLRQNFITSSVKMLQDHGFDGLDLDWEYPNRRDTVNGQADIDNFTQLLKELKEEYDKHGLFLSAAVSAVRDTASLSYDIPAISSYLDLINLMTYDMYGAWDLVTGHNAPLHAGEGDEGANKDDLYTVDVALQFWLDQGAAPEKIAVGVPFYGRSFLLADANNPAVRAPASGEGLSGPFTATNGFLGYNEFCAKLQTESWTLKYDSSAKVPYAFSGRNWVSYDDADSIAEKIQYALNHGVGGVMIWSIETDDFRGTCGAGDFPLLRAANKAIGRNGDSTESTSASPSSTESTPTSTQTTSAPTSTGESPSSSTVSTLTSTPGSTQTTSAISSTGESPYTSTVSTPTSTQTTSVPTSTSDSPYSSTVSTLTLSPDSTQTTLAPSSTDKSPSTGTFLEIFSLCVALLTTTNTWTKVMFNVHVTPTALTDGNSTLEVVDEYFYLGQAVRSVTTESLDTDSICTEEGFAPDPEDCSSFYKCVKNNDLSITAFKFDCPANLVWDQTLTVCNYSWAVECSVNIL